MKQGRLPFLLLIFFAGMANSGFASHLLGSRISWESVGKDSFKVSINAFRECSGEELVPPKPEIWCKTHNHRLTPPLKQLKVKRQVHTPGCDAYCSDCASDTCRDDQIISKHAFKSVKATYLVDLSNTNCCKISFIYKNCCRPTSLSTFKNESKRNLYTPSWVNRCKAKSLSANAFSADPKLNVCAGNPVNLTSKQEGLNAATKTFDSFRYHLVKPFKEANKPLKWKQPYSTQKPLYFEGFPKVERSAPKGFHLDSSTGLLNFIPTRKQKTIIALGAKYYKNGEVVAFQKSDLALDIIKCNRNKPPKILSLAANQKLFDTLTTCANDTASFLIKAADQNTNDHLSAHFNWQDLPGELINKKRKVLDSNTVAWKIRWLPADTISQPIIAPLRIEVRDDRCPINATDQQVYFIKAIPTPSASFRSKLSSCETVKFSPQLKSSKSSFQHQWKVDGQLVSRAKMLAKNWDNDTLDQTRIAHTITAGECRPVYRDTFSTGPLPRLKSYVDSYCHGDTLKLTAQPPSYLGTGQKINYDWSKKSGELIGKGQKVQNILDSGFKLVLTAIVTGKNGNVTCQDTAYFPITVNEAPDIQINSLPSICKNRDSVNLNEFTNTKRGQWFIKDKIIDNNSLSLPNLKKGFHTLKYRITDSNNSCSSSKKMQLKIKGLNKSYKFTDTAFCVKNPPLILPTSNNNGYLNWSGKALFDTLSGLKFDPAQADLKPDTYQLKATYNPTNDKACPYEDSFEVKLYKTDQFDYPVQQLCPYDSSVPQSLASLPEKGFWQSQNSDFRVKDSLIHRNPTDSGNRFADYYLNKGCKVASAINFRLIPEKPLAIEVPAFDEQPLCNNQEGIQLQAKPAGGQWRGPGINEQDTFNPKIAGAGERVITYQYPHPKNACFSETFDTIQINPKPVIAFKQDLINACLDQQNFNGMWQLKHHTGVSAEFHPTHPKKHSIANATEDSFNLEITQPQVMADSTLIKVNALPLKGCKADGDSIWLVKRPKPEYSISHSGTREACKFLKGKVSLNSNDSISAVKWSIRNEEKNGFSAGYHLKRQGAHNLGVTVTNQYQCSDNTWNPGYFKVLEKPSGKIKVNKTRFYLTESIQLRAEPRSADYYHWSIKNDQAFTKKLKNRHTRFTPTEAGQHNITLVVKDGKRCLDTVNFKQAFKVLEKPVVYIPDAFTPNGDGQNDKFRVRARNLESFELKIHSRSGALLYQANRYKGHSWNGYYKGELLPNGTYWYSVKIEGSLGDQQTYTGTVVLIR